MQVHASADMDADEDTVEDMLARKTIMETEANMDLPMRAEV